MALTWKSLASGQLPNAKGTLYTAPGQALITSIILVEPTGAAHTVNIYVKESGGSSRRIIPPNLPMDSSDATKAAQVECLDRPLELSLNDEIEGDADAATTIDYIITGAER